MANEKRLISVDAHKLEELLRECFGVIKSIKPTELSLMGALLVWIGCCKKPTVDAVEVAHGRWFPVKYNEYSFGGQHRTVWHLKCSSCNHIAYKQPYGLNYCPNCGAKMDGDGNG